MAAFLAGTVRADALWQGNTKIKVTPEIPLAASAFDLRDVRLLDGPFRRAMDLDHKYLLSLDPQRLLHTFRLNAGLPSAAQPLGGWEEPKCEIRGHFVGHYLSACALMYASTGDEKLREKGFAVVAGLAECQEKLGSGYLSAFPEEFLDRVEALKPVWAPYYTLHKLYAGLLDMYVYCDDRQALRVCKKFADWLIARNARLTGGQMQAMLGNEHGGMNEALANLYGLTGEEKYLAIARRFNHMAVLQPAAQRQDTLTGLHANTQIPKFVGTARQYELTGEEWFHMASLFFWNTVAKERSYVIGGHSDGEHFSPKEHLSEALGPATTETCNTYNMLKLTRHLFCWEPRAEYADFYERALYNHILSSQSPDSGMMCYYVPLRSGSRKEYNSPLDSFWCCTGTGVENHAKYGDSIYFHDGDKTLYVNLFIASELNWKELGLKLRQETGYPAEGATRLTFTCPKPVQLSVAVRNPWWAKADFAVRVNGWGPLHRGKAGSYVTLSRTWTDGDTVEIRMPFSLYTEAFRDNPRRFAFMHGPLVLCAEVAAGKPMPAVVAQSTDILGSLKPLPGKPSTFAASADVFRVRGDTHGGGVILEPFYKMHEHRHYVVYWDAFTPAQWQTKEAEYRAEEARRKQWEARTVDSVNPGEEQSERDHRLAAERSGSGEFNGRKWRDASDGGCFAWQLKVLPERPQQLCVTYWGSDRGGREFDILVDGAKIAGEKLDARHPDKFFDEVYPIPQSLTARKQNVTVRFQGRPGKMAGGVFHCRIIKPE
ncbi:MAG: beta-L-arabinofuranosidase domain-containing protein [Thermoguttaceae bacterium]